MSLKVENLEIVTTDKFIKITDTETGIVYKWINGSKTINVFTVGNENNCVDTHSFSHEKPIGSINKFEALRRMKNIILEDRKGKN